MTKQGLKKLLEDYKAYSPELHKILSKEMGLDLPSIEERKSEFRESLRPFVEEYGKEMIFDFFKYWGEHGDRDKKMRFEKQKSWNTKLRLKKWQEMSRKFSIVSMLKKK